MIMEENMRKWLSTPLLFSLFLLFVVLVAGIIFNSNYISNNDVGYPRMDIKLSGVSLEELNSGEKSTRYFDNTVSIKSYGFERTIKGVELKGRGNYSWLAEKKSYSIKFPYKVSLLNLDKQKKWGLIANYLDDSSLRNDLGHFIASVITGKSIVNGDYIELMIDDRDMGLYYLSELVSIGKNLIDLRDPMAVVVEFDQAYCNEGRVFEETDLLRDCFVLEDEKNEYNDKNMAFESFMSDYNLFEKALLNKEYEKVFEYVDKKSWVEYYLMSEFTGDIDAYVTSWFLYKDGLEDKIHTGVDWDFDAAFGNKNWGARVDAFYSPNEVMSRLKFTYDERDNYVEYQRMGCRYEYEKEERGFAYVSPVMCYMVDIPEFMDEVSSLYRERLMGKRSEILNYIRDKAGYIKKAAIRDNEMWGKGDFDEAVDYLVWWVDKRFDLFDRLYGGVKTEFLEEPSEL